MAGRIDLHVSRITQIVAKTTFGEQVREAIANRASNRQFAFAA